MLITVASLSAPLAGGRKACHRTSYYTAQLFWLSQRKSIRALAKPHDALNAYNTKTGAPKLGRILNRKPKIQQSKRRVALLAIIVEGLAWKRISWICDKSSSKPSKQEDAPRVPRTSHSLSGRESSWLKLFSRRSLASKLRNKSDLDKKTHLSILQTNRLQSRDGSSVVLSRATSTIELPRRYGRRYTLKTKRSTVC